MKTPSMIVLCALLTMSVASIAQADPVKSGGEAVCDMSLTAASMTDAEVRRMNKEGQADRFIKQGNGYYMGYVFAHADFDAELVMGVYSSCGEHAGKNGLGDFINKSNIVNNTNGQNPFQVFYEQSGSWGFSGGEYTVENTIKAEKGGYILATKLIDSSDATFSPNFASGYMRVVPDGKGVFVVACNYMIPRSGFAKGTYNGMAHDRLIASGKNLLKWVSRVSQNSGKADSYRQKLNNLPNK
ncbi:MAG: hypothetical protein HY074_03170 [Deltaproteobacteria bacterium]|nr:hypothetical protein [Deltaproteobacteria bacterium]